YNLGLAFRKKGYLSEALAEYRLAVQRGEDRDLAEHAMAEVYLLRRDVHAALELYDQLLTRQPDSPKLWNERGVALHQSGQYLEAQDSYRRAIQAEQGYALALNNLGVALYHSGQPEPAFDAFRRALEANATFVKARLNQALLLYKGKRLQMALEAYRQVLAIDGEHPVAWNGVGLVLADLPKIEDFEFDPRVLDSLFTELRPAQQRSSVAAAIAADADPFAMAQDFLSKGFFDRAQVEATRALARGGDGARGRTLLGDIFAKQGL